MDIPGSLAALSKAGSVHGHEAVPARLLETRWAPWLSDLKVDKLGNFIGRRNGTGAEPRPKVAAAAHMDTIGFLVKRVEDGGFLRLAPVGGADCRLLSGQEVDVLGRRQLTGVIGARPPHLSTPEERNQLPPVAELFVDLGLPENEVRDLVPIGTVVLFRHEVARLRNDRLTGRYLDDAAGLAVIEVALEALAGGPGHIADFLTVGTVGEETGCAGAAVMAYGEKPNVAIAVDVTFGTYLGESDPTAAFPLGSGPVIGVGPNCHPKLTALLREVAGSNDIPYGLEVLPGPSGTDAWAMQVARGGIPTAILSVPLRYMHTPVETLSLNDVASAGRLLARMVEQVDWDLVGGLSCY